MATFPNIYIYQATPAANSVVITFSVNPNGSNTTAWMEYGTGSNLGTFQQTAAMNVGSGSSATGYSITVPNLEPSTTYYFRVAANNGQTTVKSDIFSQQATAGYYSNYYYQPTPAPTPEHIVYIYKTVTVPATTTQYTPTTTTSYSTTTTGVTTFDNQNYQNNQTNQTTGTNLSANALFGKDFLPTTAPNWIALIIMICVLVTLFRKIYLDSKRTTIFVGHGESADHISHLPH